ncbi:uncharacterized protein LOC129968468 [Argiope bruennichi]|uniref:uncharacterized protein LOC129968468 n=1 Tax=Argiope bruennichi TaxID=94029 RepID=UPI00249463D7|nr:uncharacterized protein LOC129968468 [Argiope bruennichi]
MAAASIPSTSGIQQTPSNNKEEEKVRPYTIEELLIQIENHLYKSSTHRASLLIAVWSCLGGRIGYFRNIEKVFHMLYRESALMIFGGHWATIDILFKRGLARALIQYSHVMGKYVEGSEGLCSALVMAVYDPWGDPIIRKLLNQEDVELNLLKEFISSEPHELLLLRIECLVNAHFEEAAIRLLRVSLHSVSAFSLNDEECDNGKDWKWPYMEWLLRLLFRKRRLNDIILETSSCSCHDGVRLIYRSFQSSIEDSEALTGTLINIFLVRDLLFKSNYCCTSELMKLWCEFQAKKQKSASEIQEAARKLLVGHASSSAQFYLFVDILWAKFGISLLPLYLEMYIRGLTSDLNFLEAARQVDNKEYVMEIEDHMAAMYFKLFTLFNAINKEIALECLMSSFSLVPTKERLEWIKKLSLQISKEKALKAAAANDDSKNKQNFCNKSGCPRNCIHPSTVKRKPVMCDQAIQVGDDSFADFENLQGISMDNLNLINQGSCDSPKPQTVMNSNDKIADNLEIAMGKNKQQLMNTTDEILTNKVQMNGNSIKNVDSDLIVLKEKTCLCKSGGRESNCRDGRCIQDTVDETNGNVNNSNVISEQAVNLVKDCSILGDETKTTSSSGFYHDNSSVVNSETVNISTGKVVFNSKVDKIKNMSSFVNHEVNDEDRCVLDKSAIDIQGSSTEKLTNDIPINYTMDAQKKALNSSTVIKDGEGNSNCPANIKEIIHVNGYMETDTTDEKTLINTNEDKKSESETMVCISNNVEPESHNFTESTDGKITLSEKPKENYQDAMQSEMTSSSVPQLFKVPAETNPSVNENEPMMTRRSNFLKNGHSVTFSHIVLDSKIPGISSDITSDFVIVLESLRNRQLKSSCKWSQIKHLCENYLNIVANAREKMREPVVNNNAGNAADSISELFEFNQSIDSMSEDHYADKSHVLRRFMNSDNAAGIGTYINLSDIHCPQIPLDKLFYSDHSSSHLMHKKKHKRHRNHDKNTDSLLGKKIRHGSRTQREQIKRKKKKKRKAKRTKGHTKKHHFTHGKVTKEYVKTKKKKHKLKKKKEGNSGFISGDYCSDISSGALMRLVKEHSHNYSKFPASTSKHPYTSAVVLGSASSSDANDEPQRKKRKISKKRVCDEKCHDKHKRIKSKSGKRKKTVVMESCKTDLKNIMENNEIDGNVDSVNDYSRIVQFSSVKKMEAVQIRQRSVALNLSKVNNKPENKAPSVIPCQVKPQKFSSDASPLEQFVSQNFDNYSPEDIMKMQLLMARQQPVSALTTTVSTTNSQAVVKYVCSKTTSRLLSVAQTNCTLGSDSEASKSPVPTFTSRTSAGQKMSSVLHQPQNLSTNVKHFLIESNNKPYKISGNTAMSCGSVVPASLSGSNYTDVHNLTGTVLSGNINYPGTSTSPQVTAFALPVAANPLGGKLVGNKIVIPLPPCGHLRTTAPGMALIPSDSSNFASISGSQPSSNIIIVKNGNNTQIIHAPQHPNSSHSYIASTKVTPVARSRNINPVVSKTVPKMIKQAAKKLVQPVVKRTITKTSTISKPNNKDFSNLSKPMPLSISDTSTTSALNNTSIEPSPESLLVQRAIAEAKRAIAESNPDRPLDLKSVPKENSETITKKEETASLLTQSDSKIVAKESLETEEISVSTPGSPRSNESNSAKIEKEMPISDDPVSLELEGSTETPVLSEETDKLESNKSDLSDKSNEKPVNEHVAEVELKSVPQSPEEEASAVKVDTDPEQENVPNCIVTESETISKITSPTDKTSIETAENVDSENKSPAIEENQPTPVSDDTGITEPVATESKTRVCSAPVSPTISDQPKELQPIDTSDTTSEVKNSDKSINLLKGESRTSLPEGATRSFTSISDAVRFSLMDMDDATDSVENQVLQAFQVSHESSPNSPAYDNNSTNEGDAGETSPSSVILTTPQSTTTTELNVSRVSQRFETSVHSSETEKFADCQSTVSRTTTWILEDTSLNESSQVMQVQKSPDLDSSGEGKDDDKPKKKRKRKDRCERDLEATHKFWCEICHKGFFSAYNLRRHCRNVHKMNLPRGSSELPFGPKNTPEISFANNSQCHQQVQQNESSPSETTTPPRLGYVQQACISPKGAEFLLQSPTCENKTQDFSMKTSTNQHTSQLQSSDFQMQTPARMSNPSSSSHVPPVTPPKDFRLQNVTTTPTQLSPNKMSSITKPATSPKFQRLSTSCSTPTGSQLPKISQISLCGQPALQQQRQVAQIPSSPLVQPLTGGACQAQQLQAAQCSHFQANKQIVQQRIGQLQLMHHAGQMSQVQHSPHGIPKQTQVQPYKKSTATQQSTKLTETEKIQQAAQLAQTQQLLANQHLQKLMQIRQNAIANSGAASQLSLGAPLPGIQSPPSKSATQCFQSQIVAARQTATVAPLPTQQRNQAASYALASHDSTLHQFFPSSVQIGQEQPSCPLAFTTQNVAEFSSNPSPYPNPIPISTETSDKLDDLDQFLRENMEWNPEQAITHALNQQPGNRPSSAESIPLVIPPQPPISAQNRTGTQVKNKTSITRPKPRKPVVASCSKNLLGNLGRGVKKKSCPRKATKNLETDTTKSDVFSQNNLISQQAHGLDLMQRQCNKGTSSDIYSSKPLSKGAAVSSINETDSSDSVQCINVTHNSNSKNVSVGINFNTFSPAEKSMNTLSNAEPNSRVMFGVQNKNPFLDQCNLVNKNCSNVGDNLCDNNSVHIGSPFAVKSKDTLCDPKPTFFGNATTSMCSKRSEAMQDVFLGQRNSENCDSSPKDRHFFNVDVPAGVNYNQKLHICRDKKIGECGSALESNKDCSVSNIQNNLFLGEKTASSNSAVSVKMDNESNVNSENTALDKDSNEKNSAVNTSYTSATTGTNTLDLKDEIKRDGPDQEVKLLKSECDMNCMKFTGSEISEHFKGILDNSTKNTNCGTQNEDLPLVTTHLSENIKGKDINFNNVLDFNTDKSLLLNSTPKNSNPTENSSKSEIYEFSSGNLEKNKLEYIPSENDDINNEIKMERSEVMIEVKDSSKDSSKPTDAFCSHNKKNDEIPKSESIDKCDEKHIPNDDNHDQHSSQENKVPNSMSHGSDVICNNENEAASKRVALRIHKSQECSNMANDDQFYVAEKSLNNVKVTKKNSNKKKNNKKCKISDHGTTDKAPPLKLDINSNIQNTDLSDNGNKQDEVNGQICENANYYPDIEDSSHHSEETLENDLICISDKQKHQTSEEIPTGRLRLRDTPKTSVKRVCPCCIDSRMPKKCRANGGNFLKLFGSKVPNSNKAKTTLKTKNASNSLSSKVNTRSSQRLRSRNNAIS